MIALFKRLLVLESLIPNNQLSNTFCRSDRDIVVLENMSHSGYFVTLEFHTCHQLTILHCDHIDSGSHHSEHEPVDFIKIDCDVTPRWHNHF